MVKEEDDVIGQLLSEEEKADLKRKEDEVEQLKKEEKEAKAKLAKMKPPASSSSAKETLKSEEVAFETPQDRFRKIMKDQGYRHGVENTTDFFFRGDTNSPEWLEYTLKLGNIPPKNRELIISTYYGKSIEELGVKIEVTSNKGAAAKLEEKPKASEETDIGKMADDEIKDMIKNEKYMTSLAQIRAMRDEADDRRNRIQKAQQPQPPAQTTTAMRQIQRPLMLPSGDIAKNKDGSTVYETLLEPIPSSGASGGSSDLVTALVLKMLDTKNQPSTESSETVKALQAMSAKVDTIQSQNEIQRKEDEIKRITEKAEKEREEAKKDRERQEEGFKERLDRMEKERIRDLQELKERFQETIKHKEELDNVIGGVQQTHKKEMDEIKKRLEHAQTSIERTVVAKGTETADKMTTKVGDIAESIIKPMAEVMKDHYTTVIDQQRKALGLPELKTTIPKVNDRELEDFAKGG